MRPRIRRRLLHCKALDRKPLEETPRSYNRYASPARFGKAEHDPAKSRSVISHRAWKMRAQEEARLALVICKAGRSPRIEFPRIEQHVAGLIEKMGEEGVLESDLVTQAHRPGDEDLVIRMGDDDKDVSLHTAHRARCSCISVPSSRTRFTARSSLRAVFVRSSPMARASGTATRA